MDITIITVRASKLCPPVVASQTAVINESLLTIDRRLSSKVEAAFSTPR